MTSALADQLCVADRQLLILKLAQSIEGDQVWLHPDCINCHEPFDLGYQRSLLPVTTVDENVLIDSFQNGVSVNLGKYSFKFRLPNGGDQVAIFAMDNEDALSCLIERITFKEDSVKLPAPGSLTAAQINAISEALDEVTPQLADELVTECPSCHFKQTVVLDPYHMKGLGEDYLLQDISLPRDALPLE